MNIAGIYIMKANRRSPDDEFSDEEAKRRFEAVVKRMANTPPQPHRAKPKPDKAKERLPRKERAHRPKSRS